MNGMQGRARAGRLPAVRGLRVGNAEGVLVQMDDKASTLVLKKSFSGNVTSEEQIIFLK